MRLAVRAGVVCLIALVGCASEERDGRIKQLEGKPLDLDKLPILREHAEFVSRGLRVEGIGLVTGLAGTGSDPTPGPVREQLVVYMTKMGVEKPEEILAGLDTSLVFLSATVPSGARKGDRFDVSVTLPRLSRATGLHGGWLLRAELREIGESLTGTPLRGRVVGFAQGPLIGPVPRPERPSSRRPRDSRILGGGRATIDRPLQLMLRPASQGVLAAGRIGRRLNARFPARPGSRLDEATAMPKTEKLVLANVPPRYRRIPGRFVQALRWLPLSQSDAQFSKEIQRYQRWLSDPKQREQGALGLEAVGSEARPALREGLTSSEPETRFFSAEALAYLDFGDGLPQLADVARDGGPHQLRAIEALAVLGTPSAQTALRGLLNNTSRQARAGALLALRDLGEPSVRSPLISDRFELVEVDTGGTMFIWVRTRREPLIVVFGRNVRLWNPMTLEPSPGLLVRADSEDLRCQVYRFRVGSPSRYVECPFALTDVVRAVTKLGGGYDDIVALLQMAAKRKNLLVPLELEPSDGSGPVASAAARPRSGRSAGTGPGR